MKYLLIIIVIASILLIGIFITLLASTSWLSSKEFCTHKKCFTVEPYGLFNKETKKEGIKYELSLTSVFVSIIFSETLIIPVILCGWYLWEPVGIE